MISFSFLDVLVNHKLWLSNYNLWLYDYNLWLYNYNLWLTFTKGCGGVFVRMKNRIGACCCNIPLKAEAFLVFIKKRNKYLLLRSRINAYIIYSRLLAFPDGKPTRSIGVGEESLHHRAAWDRLIYFPANHLTQAFMVNIAIVLVIIERSMATRCLSDYV